MEFCIGILYSRYFPLWVDTQSSRSESGFVPTGWKWKRQMGEDRNVGWEDDSENLRTRDFTSKHESCRVDKGKQIGRIETEVSDGDVGLGQRKRFAKAVK